MRRSKLHSTAADATRHGGVKDARINVYFFVDRVHADGQTLFRKLFLLVRVAGDVLCDAYPGDAVDGVLPLHVEYRKLV